MNTVNVQDGHYCYQDSSTFAINADGKMGNGDNMVCSTVVLDPDNSLKMEVTLPCGCIDNDYLQSQKYADNE